MALTQGLLYDRLHGQPHYDPNHIKKKDRRLKTKEHALTVQSVIANYMCV